MLTFSSAAWHLKPRDRWLEWSPRQVEQRRHLIAQNSRFLLLSPPGRCPNLASRALRLVCDRLSRDWEQHFGHPVLAVETFVDPQHYRGTAYKAAGWQRLGPTQGYGRAWQDFYTDTQHPKELWVRPLGKGALERLRAKQLEPALAQHARPVPPSCPLPFAQLTPLWTAFHQRMSDPRKPWGQSHPLASILTLIALAMMAGCQGPHAIFEFARSLTHPQRRALRCRPRKDRPKQYDVPCERTFRRMLQALDPEALKHVLMEWMAAQEVKPLSQLHWDGKVLKNARLADQQTPLTLVNVMTPDQRLVEQIPVPLGTNEQAAVSQRLPQLNLQGLLVT
ncbi:MAG TPA: transposase family protein, partial [Candidatus Methylomirabilis sp.]|nr:transposase family protein [Candidatus Methylomirabilis sp.]